MRFLATLALVALCGLGVARADDADKRSSDEKPSVKFDGGTLFLTWQNDDDKPTIREFIPKGQDLETWTTLASLRDYPDLDDPFLICGAMAKRATDLAADAQGRVTENKETGAAVVDFLAWPEDKSFVEFNVFRYRKAKQGGLIAEQYAVRDYKDPESFVKKLKPLRERLVQSMLKHGLEYLDSASADAKVDATDKADDSSPSDAKNDSNGDSDAEGDEEMVEVQEVQFD